MDKIKNKIYSGARPPLLFYGKLARGVVFLKGKRVCNMQRYTVDDVRDNGLFASVTMHNHGYMGHQTFPSDFVRGMKKGDRLVGIGQSLTVVWTYHDRIHMLIEPVSDYGIRTFVTEKLGMRDGIHFRWVLCRALLKCGIMPTMSVSNNLRLYLANKRGWQR